jgi:hypothetical protein
MTSYIFYAFLRFHTARRQDGWNVQNVTKTPPCAAVDNFLRLTNQPLHLTLTSFFSTIVVAKINEQERTGHRETEIIFATSYHSFIHSFKMSTGIRRINNNNEQQSVFTRQSTILRKNLGEWDAILRNPRGEDWSKMLGRLNAALNQSANMDKSIEDVLEHFVYLPKQSTANAQDIPFFLSTRLEAPTTDEGQSISEPSLVQGENPVQVLSKYEMRAAQLAQEFDDEMVRF